MKIRRKPTVMEAQRLTVDNLYDMERWCGGAIKGAKLPIQERVIDIQTFGSEGRANIGDWIIKGIGGEFYPCKPGIFEATYEEGS